MKKTLIGLALAMTFSAASALPITGSIESGDGGMYATGGWDSGNAELSWSVSESDGRFTYVYHWMTKSKALSHIIFGVSDTFTSGNVLSGTTSGWELGTWSTQGNSNPGIPSPLYGLKFSGNDTDETFTIVSDRPPMCGNFYAKDGRDGGQDVYAYNDLFSREPLDCMGSGNYAGYVLVPDTKTTNRVPEPGTMALFGVGVIGLMLRKKTKSA